MRIFKIDAAFPTIDRYDQATGLVTSVKSLDLGAKTYQDMGALQRTLNGYIDSVAKFDGARFSGREVGLTAENPIVSRALDLVIPNMGSSAQQKVLNQAVQYGQSKGVTVNLKQI